MWVACDDLANISPTPDCKSSVTITALRLCPRTLQAINTMQVKANGCAHSFCVITDAPRWDAPVLALSKWTTLFYMSSTPLTFSVSMLDVGITETNATWYAQADGIFITCWHAYLASIGLNAHTCTFQVRYADAVWHSILLGVKMATSSVWHIHNWERPLEAGVVSCSMACRHVFNKRRLQHEHLSHFLIRQLLLQPPCEQNLPDTAFLPRASNFWLSTLNEVVKA